MGRQRRIVRRKETREARERTICREREEEKPSDAVKGVEGRIGGDGRGHAIILGGGPMPLRDLCAALSRDISPSRGPVSAT